MPRYDLRHLKDNFSGRMVELLDAAPDFVVCIFMFVIGVFCPIHKS